MHLLVIMRSVWIITNGAAVPGLQTLAFNVVHLGAGRLSTALKYNNLNFCSTVYFGGELLYRVTTDD